MWVVWLILCGVFLLIEIFASNIGGTATLIGDPPNILIGSALELSFTDFLFHLTPIVLVIMAAVVAMFVYFWKDSLKASLKNRALVMNINEYDALTDVKLLKKALWVLGMVIAAFMVAHDIGFENGFIALAGAAGVLYAMNYSTIVPSQFDFNQSILILVYVVLGGMGNISGSIISAAFLTVLPEILRPINQYRMLLYAIVLILVMVVPHTRIYQRIAEALRGRLRKAPADAAMAAEGGEGDE